MIRTASLNFAAARRDRTLHARRGAAFRAGHRHRHRREDRGLRRSRNVHFARGDDGRRDDQRRRSGLRLRQRGRAGEDCCCKNRSNHYPSILSSPGLRARANCSSPEGQLPAAIPPRAPRDDEPLRGRAHVVERVAADERHRGTGVGSITLTSSGVVIRIHSTRYCSVATGVSSTARRLP